MRTRASTSTSWVARGLALVALVLLMGSLSWVRTFAVYTVAWIDGSHAPHVGYGPDGFQVVLGHGHFGHLGTETTEPGPGHIHRLGARLLILLAQENGPHADHVVMLGADGGPFETGRETRMSSMPQKSSCPPAPVVRVDRSIEAPRTSKDRFAEGPPPSLTALNLQLRCTRLLI